MRKKKSNTDIKTFSEKMGIGVLIYLCIGVSLLGSALLYTCKVAESQILPDDSKSIPYGTSLVELSDNVNSSGDEINTKSEVMSNIIRDYKWHGLGWMFEPNNSAAQVIQFDAKQIINTYFDGMYGKLYTHKKSNNAVLYFYHILTLMFSLGNSGINKIFGFFAMLPEWAVLIILPIVIMFWPMYAMMGVVGLFGIISVLGHIIYIRDLFLKKQNPADPKSDWEDYNNIKYFNMRSIFIIMILLTILFLGGALISVMGVAAISAIGCLLSPFYAQYSKPQSNDPDAKHSFFNFVPDVIIHHRHILFGMLTCLTIINSYKYLGNMYTIGILIAIIIAIKFNIYNQHIPDDSSFQNIADINISKIKKIVSTKFDDSLLMRLLSS